MGKRKKKLSKKLYFLIFSHKNYSSLVLIVVLQNVTHLNNLKFSLSYYMSFICLTCMLNFIPIRCCTVQDPWALWAFNPSPTIQTLALTPGTGQGPKLTKPKAQASCCNSWPKARRTYNLGPDTSRCNPSFTRSITSQTRTWLLGDTMS